MAPETVPDNVAKLLADWPGRFAGHHLAGVLTIELGNYEGGRTEMELARGWAEDESEDFVFGPHQFDVKETVASVSSGRWGPCSFAAAPMGRRTGQFAAIFSAACVQVRASRNAPVTRRAPTRRMTGRFPSGEGGRSCAAP